MEKIHWKTALKVLNENNADTFTLDENYGEVTKSLFRLTCHNNPNIVVDLNLEYLVGRLHMVYVYTIDGRYCFWGEQCNKPIIRKFLFQLWQYLNRLKDYTGELYGNRSKELISSLTIYLTGVKILDNNGIVIMN